MRRRDPVAQRDPPLTALRDTPPRQIDRLEQAEKEAAKKKEKGKARFRKLLETVREMATSGTSFAEYAPRASRRVATEWPATAARACVAPTANGAAHPPLTRRALSPAAAGRACGR